MSTISSPASGWEKPYWIKKNQYKTEEKSTNGGLMQYLPQGRFLLYSKMWSMHDTGCSGLVHWDDPEG